MRRGWNAAGILVAALAALAACGTPSAAPGSGTLPSTSGGPTSTSAWQALPKAPVAGRIGEGVVWTGKEMIVWGGVPRGAKEVGPAAGDGAAYDPATNAWRTLAPAPSGVAGHVAAAVAWTGKVAVFWAGNMLAPPSPGGALYDPRTDTWRRIPVGPLGGREGYASVWTGREMLVIAGYEGQGMDRPVAAALNPATRTWRVLKGMEPLWGLSPNGAVWSGESVFVPGTLQLCPEQGVMCRRTRPIFLSYTPSTDRVREIGTAGAPFPSKRLARLIPLGWTGSAVVFWTRYEPSAGIVTYTPASGAWAVAPPAPCVLQGSGYEQAAWIDARVALPCGRIGLQIYDVATGRWQRVETGPSPLDGRDGSAVVWTGTDLIVWSGILDRPHNPAPNSGARIRLAS